MCVCVCMYSSLSSNWMCLWWLCSSGLQPVWLNLSGMWFIHFYTVGKEKKNQTKDVFVNALFLTWLTADHQPVNYSGWWAPQQTRPAACDLNFWLEHLLCWHSELSPVGYFFSSNKLTLIETFRQFVSFFFFFSRHVVKMFCQKC